MKKTIFIACLALASLNVSVAQIISYQANYSSFFPSTNEEATRVLYHQSDLSLVYIDSVNHPYLCFNHTSAPFTSLAPLFYYSTMNLPFQIKVNDMKKKLAFEFLCGNFTSIYDYNNYGYYARVSYQIGVGIPNALHLFQLDDIKNLKKAEPVITLYNDSITESRLFAIGETHNTWGSVDKNHLLELHIFGHGISESTPYPYATFNTQETADDITSTSNWLAVSTRDTRADHAPINLRVSNLTQVLGNTEIDYQWQFFLSKDEKIVGKALLEHLQDDELEMCYIKYNAIENRYLLCLHRIRIPDLAIGNGVLGTQEFKVNPDEVLEDIMYISETETLVVLTNRENQYSIFYHTLPFVPSPYLAIRLESAVGDKYYSLSKVDNHLWPAGFCLYQAWGGSQFFMQEVGPSGSAAASCLSLFKSDAIIKAPKKTQKNWEPLERNTGTRRWIPCNFGNDFRQGLLDCSK